MIRKIDKADKQKGQAIDKQINRQADRLTGTHTEKHIDTTH